MSSMMHSDTTASVVVDPRFIAVHTLAQALKELENRQLPRDRFHVKLVFEYYVHIKLEKGHKKPYVAQKLDVLEKALVDKGYPDWSGPFAMQTRAENSLPKSTVYPRNGVSDINTLLAEYRSEPEGLR